MLKILLIILNLFAVAFCDDCGRSGSGYSFSFGGEYAQMGQWPWLVPLFTRVDTFLCSSSIISEKFLLSGEKKKIINIFSLFLSAGFLIKFF